MSFSFKYKPALLTSGIQTRRPLIPITFKGELEMLDFFGILDTGSDRTVIPKDIAEVLGVKYVGDNEVTGITGKKIKAKDGYIEVIFGKDREECLFTIPIVVPEEDSGKEQIIIGRDGFFDQFKITFCEAEKRMTFKRYVSKQKF